MGTAQLAFEVVVLPEVLILIIVLIIQSADKGIVRWQLADVQFVQVHHPLVWE